MYAADRADSIRYFNLTETDPVTRTIGTSCSYIGGWGWDTSKKEDKYNHLIPERVIFNKKATICFWKDGTKTVVNCQPGDTYSEEEGILQCIAKKAKRDFMKKDRLLKRLVKRAYRQPGPNAKD